MRVHLGVKSDPIEYRYSYSWLFNIMNQLAVDRLQLGSFFELYSLPDAYFNDLKEEADSYGIRISSLFTAHRELGGFFTGNGHMEAVARKNYERMIEIAALLGADYAGSNPGAVYRDQMQNKDKGIETYLKHMKELMQFAHEVGLRGLCIEPMSCLAEPPSLPDEMEYMLETLNHWHTQNPDTTVAAYLCGDISHGYIDRRGKELYSNTDLFRAGIPWMSEFHIKNTDSVYGSTFGFTPSEREKGIVSIEGLRDLIHRNASKWPMSEVVGYFEINGPKLGRDYSDHLLEEQIRESLLHIKAKLIGDPALL